MVSLGMDFGERQSVMKRDKDGWCWCDEGKFVAVNGMVFAED